MNLSQLRDRVRHLASIRSTTLLPDSEIDDAINEFNYTLLSAYDWPQQRGVQRVTATSALVAWPGLAERITGVQIQPSGVGLPSQLTAATTFDVDQRLTGQRGTPHLYVVDAAARRLTIYPAPESSCLLQIYFAKLVEPLSEATDSPVMDEEFHLAWAQAAAATVIRERSGDLQRAASLDARVLSAVSRMRRRYLMNHDRQAVQMPERWSR